jgi:HemY protein
MRVLLWLLTLAALAVGLSLAARYNDGYVLLVLPPWRVELSLNLLLILLVAAFILAYLSLRGVVTVLRLPGAVRQFRARRARDQADGALRDAMRLLQEGRYGHALKSAEKAFDAGHAPGLASLLALRAAHATHDPQRFELWRQRARDHEGPGGRTARLMTEARLALESRDFDEAHELIEQLAEREGRHIAALRLALGIEQGRGNWQEVLRLARQLEKHKALTPDQAAPLRLRAHRGNLAALRQDAPQLLQYWQKSVGSDRSDPRLAAEAARALAEAGDCIEAARLVEDCLDEQWDSGLVAIYGECEGGDVLARIAHGEKWLARHPRDAQLLLALGRLCRQQQLWGKAQSYLEASLAIEPTRACHVELAQLLDRLERPAEADRHYRKAAVL